MPRKRIDAEPEQRIGSAAGDALDSTDSPGSEVRPLELRSDPAWQRHRPDGLEGLHPPAAVLQADQRRLGRGDGRGERGIRRHRPGRLSGAASLHAAGRLPLAARPRDARERRRRAGEGDASDRAGQPRHADACLRRGRLGQPGDARRRAAQGPHRGPIWCAAGQHGGRIRHPRRRLRVPDRQVRRHHAAQEGGRVLYAAQCGADDGRAARSEGGREHLRPGLWHRRHAARRDRARRAGTVATREPSSDASSARRRT